MRFGGGCSVEFIFKRDRQPLICGIIRTRHSRGRHHACPQLPYNLFPFLGMIANMREVQFVQHQARSLQLLVMAGDAVLIENIALRQQRRRSLGLGNRSHTESDPNAAHVLFRINSRRLSQVRERGETPGKCRELLL